jgi:hypothetical protein
MTRKCHVRFLGGWGAVTRPGYPINIKNLCCRFCTFVDCTQLTDNSYCSDNSFFSYFSYMSYYTDHSSPSSTDETCASYERCTTSEDTHWGIDDHVSDM